MWWKRTWLTWVYSKGAHSVAFNTTTVTKRFSQNQLSIILCTAAFHSAGEGNVLHRPFQVVHFIFFTSEKGRSLYKSCCCVCYHGKVWIRAPFTHFLIKLSWCLKIKHKNMVEAFITARWKLSVLHEGSWHYIKKYTYFSGFVYHHGNYLLHPFHIFFHNAEPNESFCVWVFTTCRFQLIVFPSKRRTCRHF